VVLIIGGGLFATLSALNATIMASSRVAFSMGRDWMLPNKLSRIHYIKKTPVMSIVVSGVIFIAAAVFLPLETIGVGSSLLFLITFSLVNIAGQIALASKGEIVSLNVIEMPNITEYEEAEPFIKKVQKVLNKAQKSALIQNIIFSSLTKISRSVAPEVVRVAKENLCQLILMGYKQEKDPLENSLIHHVISHQPCDVAILKTDTPFKGPLKRILIPIGGKEIHDRLKVRLVHCLYGQEKPKVTLLTVVPPECSRIHRRRAEEPLRRARSIFHIPKAELVIEKNEHIADAVTARAKECDLLILGMREEPRFKSFFFGTLAQQIAGQVGCPTLLTKAKSRYKSRLKQILRIKPDVRILEEEKNEDEYLV